MEMYKLYQRYVWNNIALYHFNTSSNSNRYDQEIMTFLDIYFHQESTQFNFFWIKNFESQKANFRKNIYE